MSCHMKPKRSCPGVPNRYSLRPSSSRMVPKSMATVVVVLSGTAPVRSMLAATSVIAASVVSGGESEITPTVVVLPTPKPPAITIFTGVGAMGSRYCGKATDHPLDKCRIAGHGGLRTQHPQMAGRGEIGHQ